MSIFKNIITNVSARELEKKTLIGKTIYINECLPDSRKNAYYFMCGECSVIVHTPTKRLNDEYVEIFNIPTYVMRFKTPEKAQQFLENNFFIGIEHQKNVEISQVGSNVILKPTRFDYEIHIEVDSEEVGQKLVKLFRRQYIDNGNLVKIKKDKDKLSQASESEIEKLGIEF